MSIKNILTEKPVAHTYLPGIATYGIDGKNGKAGESGKSLYFTDINPYANISNLSLLRSKFIKNESLLENDSTILAKKYQTGDYVLFNDGSIAEILDIEKLTSLSTLAEADTLKDLFEIKGKIAITADNERNFFVMNNERLMMNSARYTNNRGLDLVTLSDSNSSDRETFTNNSSDTKNAVLRIASNVTNDDGSIDMLVLKSCFNLDDNDNFKISYDTDAECFIIKSNASIKIDAPAIKINASNNINDNSDDKYSTLLLSENPLTLFANTCAHLRYSLDKDSLIDESNILPSLAISRESNAYNKNEIHQDLNKGVTFILNVKARWNDNVKSYYISKTHSNQNHPEKSPYFDDSDSDEIYKFSLAPLVKMFNESSAKIDDEGNIIPDNDILSGDTTLWNDIVENMQILSVSIINCLEIFIKPY